MGLSLGLGLAIPMGNKSIEWSAYWKSQPEILFFGLYSEIADGKMPNKVTGATDYLTVSGSAGAETYQCPNTAAYIAADTDYIWFRSTDSSQRTVTTAELIGYDLQRTPVKYTDDAPHTIEAIIILNSAVTGTKRNNLFRDFWLPILWDNNLNGNGHVKANRITYNPYVPIKYLDKPLGTEYAYVADNNALDVKGHPFIMCGWVLVYDKTASKFLFGKNIAGNADGRYGFYFNQTTGYIVANAQAGITTRTITSNIDCTTGWHFVMLEVYKSGANTAIKMYIDNQLIGFDTYVYAWGTLANQFEFYIGTGNNGAGSTVDSTCKAAFRDIRIYRIPLSDNQKTQLYNNINVAGYAARWKCDAYPLVDEVGSYNLTGVNLSTANIKEI
jgi:hypothetical protein